MKPNSLYAQLELIPETPEQSVQSDYAMGRVWARAKARLRPLSNRLVGYLCGDADVRVTVRRDRQGQTAFVVYDAVTQQRHTFDSEQDLRAWADRRYYE
ncbi:hypothetical protein [Leptolyngbya sp. KIOST-1]|uniref:hypothetical protein n=1 Tax=Leptolyngbya sp. KIOST-1 TaxID=1229172 RepID=UPI000567150C|nr:hypothetical protein [Leptolyngbya sp. KIOST-1]